MKRGEVYRIRLEPRSGSEQRGVRPAVLLTADTLTQARNWSSFIVVPVSTSESQIRRGDTAIFLPAGAGGLIKDSVVLCHQVTTVDRSKLLSILGVLSASELALIELGVLNAMGIKL